MACAMGYAKGQGAIQMTFKHIMHVIRYVEDISNDLAGQEKTWRDQQGWTRIS